jgi:tRNA G26 N,N-dimethylase Trm1
MFKGDVSILSIKTFIARRNAEIAALQQKKSDRRTAAEAKRVAEGKAPLPRKEEVKEEKEKGVRVLEALSATGLRSVRYALEIPGLESILTNDIDKNAVESIRMNAAYNGINERMSSVLLSFSFLCCIIPYCICLNK